MFLPDYEEWKTEIFPEVLSDFIKSYIEDFYPSASAFDSEVICEEIREYAENNLAEAVFERFEWEGYISPELSLRPSPTDRHLFSYVQCPMSWDDIPDEYFDLDDLCDDLHGTVSAVIDAVCAERGNVAVPSVILQQ